MKITKCSFAYNRKVMHRRRFPIIWKHAYDYMETSLKNPALSSGGQVDSLHYCSVTALSLKTGMVKSGWNLEESFIKRCLHQQA